MVYLKNKFAIGCLVQWYEVELIDEYLESVTRALQSIDNKENVIVDICFNMAQNLEQVDETQMKLDDIFQRFLKVRTSLSGQGRDTRISFYPSKREEFNNEKLTPYTIADYRREFNERYCDQVDVLMWGETDALIPKQTFEVLDLLHNNNIENKTNKYIAFFGTCKMWDESWQSIEHVDFTDKPFVDMDTKNWWSLRYNMNIDEMDDINDKVEQLDVRTVNPFKFNGCGLVISSDVIKAGVNIPRSAFFIHEDTAFMFSLIKNLGENIPQFIFKNILLVHNRKHPKKRMYVKGERNIELGDVGSARKVHDWYKKASDMSHHNVYNLFNQSKIYTWEDVFK